MVDFERKDRYDLNDLLRVMELLRSPGGCPWDRAQDHHSIRRNMLEEAYEAAEAIDQEDPAHLKEELGDVLLQVVFHACMAQEAGQFDFSDVADGVTRKLVFRHPNVFGGAPAGNSAVALSTWDAQKRVEKDQRTTGDAMDAVARSLPALLRAEKVQSKAAKAGFDWPGVGPALDKLTEELEELKAAVQEGTNMEEELGDLLFAAVKVGRFLAIDSELALHAACEKFIRRFRRVETLAQGDLKDRPLSELEALWQQAKQAEQAAT